MPAAADGQASVEPSGWRAPAALFVLAAAVRAVVAARTAIPDRDAADYLWMAERVAGGDLAAAFATVFHPLYSLLVAAVLFVAPSLDGVTAGQLVACGCGALAVLPLHAATAREFGREAALAAGVFYAVGIWFARHPADCLSEGVFYPLVAGCVLALQRGRGVAAGTLAALAYQTRPEGAALALLGTPWLLSRRQRRAAFGCAVAFAVVGLLLPLGYAAFGGGFTLTPKAAFNWHVGVGDDEVGGPRHYLEHLLRLPFDALEAIGYAALPMAIAGVVLAWPLRLGSTGALCLALFALQVLVVPLLRSNIRFVSGYGVLLLPFAGLCWQRVRRRLVALPRVAVAALAVLAVSGDLVRLPVVRRADRRVLRELGEWLQPRLGAGERLVTEMPRLEYFAGQQPGPPRPIAQAEIVAAAREPATRFVAVVAARTPVDPGELEALGFRRVPLPARLGALVHERGILLLERQR